MLMMSLLLNVSALALVWLGRLFGLHVGTVSALHSTYGVLTTVHALGPDGAPRDESGGGDDPHTTRGGGGKGTGRRPSGASTARAVPSRVFFTAADVPAGLASLGIDDLVT